jgi:predicted dehydrogenase/nucleoside-diphosphate-sugar epimerase
MRELQNKQVRIALVGCGAIAYSHARAIAQVAGALCTALFDLNRASAEAVRQSLCPEARVLTELESVAEHADAAIVAVPNVHHAAVSLKLLRAGLHVLCEKPLAVSLPDAEEMADAAEQAGRLLACGLIRRFFASTELAADALRRELVGHPVGFEVRESVWNWPLNRATFDPATAGGGVLIDLAPHVFDQLATWLGPVEVLAYEDDNKGRVEATAVASVRCRTKHGYVPGVVHLTRAYRTVNRARIACTNGYIETDPHAREEIKIAFGEGAESAENFQTTAHAAKGDPFVRQMENFVKSVRGEAELIAPARAALPTVAAIDACYRQRRPSPERWTRAAGDVRGNVVENRYQKILLTGASGAIGTRLVEMWAEQGRLGQLRCMARSYRTAASIMRYPLEVVEADLLDEAAVKRAAEGCDAIIHLGVGEKASREIEPLLAAARALGIRRFVHMSTAVVYGRSLPARVEAGQESAPLVKTGEPYPDEKAKTERAVLRECARGLEAVMLRPHIVYGPRQRWSAELMELLARGEVCVVEDGGWCNLIHVDDLVRAVECALATEKGFGRPLFVTDGAPLRWSDYIDAHAKLIGARPPRRLSREVLPPDLDWRGWVRASVRPLWPIIKSNEFRSFVFESPAMQATLFRVYLAMREKKSLRPRLEKLRGAGGGAQGAGDGTGETFDSTWTLLQLSESRLSAARAEAEIGYRPRVSFAQGLASTAEWFAAYGLVPSSPSPDAWPAEVDESLAAAG